MGSEEIGFAVSIDKEELIMKKIQFLVFVIIVSLAVGRDDISSNLSISSDDCGLFPIYGLDEQAMHRDINFWIKIPQDLNLFEKLELLVKKLSIYQFERLPIIIQEIKAINGKKIVTINLFDLYHARWKKSPKLVKRWYDYFQGSAGSRFACTALIETLLQREYELEWIDGVKFLYEGEPFSNFEDDFEKVNQSLGAINYR